METAAILRGPIGEPRSPSIDALQASFCSESVEFQPPEWASARGLAKSFGGWLNSQVASNGEPGRKLPALEIAELRVPWLRSKPNSMSS